MRPKTIITKINLKIVEVIGDLGEAYQTEIMKKIGTMVMICEKLGVLEKLGIIELSRVYKRRKYYKLTNFGKEVYNACKLLFDVDRKYNELNNCRQLCK